MAAVHKALSTLNPRKSTGSDGISPRFLRECADLLAPPITHLFCLSISSGELPATWKIADVIPIPKSKTIEIDNLRPVSLLPVISKVREDFVLKSMKEKFLSIYGKNQHGFRPGASTLTAHIAIHDFITASLDASNYSRVALISFDLSRAFDKIHHKCLMNTLIDAQFPSAFLKWCGSFLRNRQQRVRTNGFISTLGDVTSGVPQGSKLAPYLFSSHMGALIPSNTDSRIFKYADDVYVVIPFTKSSNVKYLIECEFSRIKNWCNSHGLVLNEKKTKIILFSKKRTQHQALTHMSTVSDLRILGVIFQSNLGWNTHADHICKLASQRIYILKQLKRFEKITKEDLIQIYNSCIRSVLEYNCPIFIGMNRKNKRKLELVRKRCHRIICGNDCRCDALESLDSRRERIAIKLFLKSMRCDSIIRDIMPDFLPSSRRLRLPFSLTQRRSSSFIPSCTAIYNNKFS